MYVVTNREIDEKNEPQLKFGTSPNKDGIDNLRLAKVTKKNNKFVVDIIPETKKIKPISPYENNDNFSDRPSYKLFLDLQKTMKTKNRNCVFYVHGYNTNFLHALESAYAVEQLYKVEVLLFAWPSRGAGEGAQHIGENWIGTASYKRDKRIAQKSVVALDRCFELLNLYFEKMRSEQTNGEHPNDCGQRMTLFCHSMGNYLLKSLMKSSVYQSETLIFDNVVLCAADVNNENHNEFVDKIAHRRRIYITINENDYALGVSRMKLGDAQKARLGHYTRNLNSSKAVYLDFTDAKKVGKSHGYFADDAAKTNLNVKKIFNLILNGERGERILNDFDPNSNIYSIA